MSAGPVGVDQGRSDELVRRVYQWALAERTPIQATDEARIQAHVRTAAPLANESEVASVVARVMQSLFGLGPLEPLIHDPQVTEVMVNGPGTVWVERASSTVPSQIVIDADGIAALIDRVLGPLGLRVDRTSPFADARLIDGSRVHVAVPPMAIDGPYVTIRRFRDRPFRLSHFGPADVVSLLRHAVERRLSLIVSGGTGSGKTSLLNALGAVVPDYERVITIEDAAELRLPGAHVLRLEARPANAEGVGAVSIRTLVRNALRMRPDRIIVGEVRGAEALDMVQAMNTGHEGSMSTCHANSPLDALRRLESMMLMSDVDLPVEVARDHLQAAIDLVIQVERDARGRRRVVSVHRCGERSGWLVRNGVVVAAGPEFLDPTANPMAMDRAGAPA